MNMNKRRETKEATHSLLYQKDLTTERIITTVGGPWVGVVEGPRVLLYEEFNFQN